MEISNGSLFKNFSQIGSNQNFKRSDITTTTASVECNETCCDYGETICFDELYFTDFSDLEETAAWELILRWSYIIPLVLISFLGNSSVIIILLKNSLLMRSSVNVFIMNLSVADLILTVAGPIPFTIRDTHQFWVLGKHWCNLDGYIQMMVMAVSVMSLTTISVDRMLGIMSPMHTHLKRWQAKIIIALIWIIAALLAIPFYIYRLYSVRIWADVKETYCGEITEKTILWYFFIIIFINWIPLIIMTLAYIFMFFSFQNHALKMERREHPTILRLKKRFLKMIFVVIITYCFCWIPFQAFIIFREIIVINNDSEVEKIPLYDDLLTVTQYIVYLNPAIDPFIYGLMHQNFKKGFRLTFSCFFKNEADFYLVKGQGTQAYAWKRSTIKRTNRRKMFQNRTNADTSKSHDTNVEVGVSNSKRINVVTIDPNPTRK